MWKGAFDHSCRVCLSLRRYGTVTHSLAQEMGGVCLKKRAREISRERAREEESSVEGGWTTCNIASVIHWWNFSLSTPLGFSFHFQSDERSLKPSAKRLWKQFSYNSLRCWTLCFLSAKLSCTIIIFFTRRIFNLWHYRASICKFSVLWQNIDQILMSRLPCHVESQIWWVTCVFLSFWFSTNLIFIIYIKFLFFFLQFLTRNRNATSPESA